MKLIKDLGIIPISDGSKYRARFGIYECSICKKHFKVNSYKVKSRNQDSCKKCVPKKSITHNLSNHRIYEIWNGMMQRCYNKKRKNYCDYGKKGIKVCEDWHNVENFINDMYPSFKEGLTLDRIDVYGNYNKDNCRWANKSTQSRNTRRLISTNKSGYRGVCKTKNNNFEVQIKVNRKSIYLGRYKCRLQGAYVYDEYVRANNLEHTTNF